MRALCTLAITTKTGKFRRMRTCICMCAQRLGLPVRLACMLALLGWGAHVARVAVAPILFAHAFGSCHTEKPRRIGATCISIRSYAFYLQLILERLRAPPDEAGVELPFEFKYAL